MSHPFSRMQGGGFWGLRGQYCLMIWTWQRALSLQVHRWYVVGKNGWYAGPQSSYSKLLWQAGNRKSVWQRQMQSPPSGLEKDHAKAEASMDWLEGSFAEKNLEVLVGRGLKMSQKTAGQQQTAAYWVVPVRLARKSSPLSGTPEVTFYSLGFSITRRTLTECCEFTGGHQDKWGVEAH